MPTEKKTTTSTLPTISYEDQKNPTILTPELISNIEQHYRLGLKDQAVANIVGVSVGILIEWLVKGQAKNHGAHGDLFRRCAKAVGVNELEFVAKIREHALGTPAIIAYDEEHFPDGRIIKKVRLDNEGQPIILKEEVKANPVWAAWYLERRHGKNWSKNDSYLLGNSTPDKGLDDAQLNGKIQRDESNIPVSMSYEEQREMIDLAARLLDEEHSKSKEKDVTGS